MIFNGSLHKNWNMKNNFNKGIVLQTQSFNPSQLSVILDFSRGVSAKGFKIGNDFWNVNICSFYFSNMKNNQKYK
jgi:hypothetical protein